MDYNDFFEKVSEDWKKKNPKWDMKDSILILSLLRCSFELQVRTEEIFEEFDLNTATFGLLATLYRSSPSEGMMPSELTRHVLVSPGSVTNRIDRLIVRGLVERNYSKEDRRIQYIKLTSSGKKLLEKIMPLHLENESKLLEALTKTEKRELQKLTLKLLNLM